MIPVDGLYSMASCNVGGATIAICDTGLIMPTLFEQYKRTEHWRRLESKAIKGAACCKCGEETFLLARHKTYERLGQELLTDLEVICAYCDKVWSLPEPDIKLCDPHGWCAYHIIVSRDWNGCEQVVMNAWYEHRTLGAALEAYRNEKNKHRRRKFADPERPDELRENYF